MQSTRDEGSTVSTRHAKNERWADDTVAGFATFFITGALVICGVIYGVYCFSNTTSNRDPVSACLRFSAVEYLRIMMDGYSYDPSHQSLVAFFPAYPLLARWVNRATGIPADEAALLTSNIALLAAFILLVRWVRLRSGNASARETTLVLLAFGLWPAGLFFRMPYAESLLLFGTLAFLCAMATDWPPIALALIAGLVTSIRPVGIALTGALFWRILTGPGNSVWSRLRRALLFTPLASWGLLAYMIYQWIAFGTPWAFIQTQEHWTSGIPEARSWHAKLWSLAIFEPIWGVYVPSSTRWWGGSGDPNPLFNLSFWNPIFFAVGIGLLTLGAVKRWLTGTEVVLGALLLAIPYVTRSYEMSMASHARFAAVVVVNYLVIGRILAKAPILIVGALYVLSGLWLFLWTALYVSGHSFY